MIALLLLLILAVVLCVIFANMTLYVIGGVVGILLVIALSIIKRRKQK